MIIKRGLFLIVYSLVLAWFVADFSYKRGAYDSITASTYTEAANNFVALKILRENGAEKTTEFLESQLDWNIVLNKHSAENKSVLHQVLEIGQHKPNDEYYRHILDYRTVYPSDNKTENIVGNLKWLINNSEEIF